jgi:hypothetical protein
MERAGLRRRTALIAASVAFPLLAVGAMGVVTARAQGDVHVLILAEETRLRTLDFDGDGVLGLGDRIATRAPLVEPAAPGNRMGTSFGDCLAQRIITHSTGLWRCSYVLRLADGTIVLDGLDPRGPGAYVLSVTGGTGAYEGVSGQAALTDTRTTTEIQITFAS